MGNNEQDSLLGELEALKKENACIRQQLAIHDALQNMHGVTEKALSESEERLRYAIEATQDGIWDWNISTGLVSFSPRCYTMLGYSFNEFPPTFDSWDSLAHQDDKEKASLCFQKHIHNNEPYDIEARMKHKSGNWHWILTRGKVVERDGQGNPMRMIGTFSDIHERKKIEEALLERENHLNEAQRLAHLGSWDWDAAKDVVIWSDELYRIVGMQPGSPTPNRAEHQALLTPDSWIIHENSIQHALETGEPFEVELEIVRIDGVHRWVINRGAAEMDAAGNIIRIIGSLQDITERKMILDELEKSRNELQSTIDATTSGIYKFDLSTQELYLNQKAYTMHGYEPGEFPTDTEYIKQHLIHPDDVKILTGAIEECIYSKSHTYEVEYRIRKKNGEYHWIHSNGKVVEWDDDGKPLRLIGNHTDISERKLSEEKIRASLEEKEILLKEIHHRVKNNLQAISSLLSLQMNQFKEPRLREAFIQMKNRIRSMAMVHEKLYTSHDIAHINFGNHIKSIANELISAYGNDDIILEVEADNVPVELEKAVPLSLILNELVSNALVHAFPGRSAGTLQIYLHKVGNDDIILVIRDNGKGFPDNVDLRESSTLGLTLINALVSQIDGTIEMSKENGTTFTIKFKVSDNTHKESKYNQ